MRLDELSAVRSDRAQVYGCDVDGARDLRTLRELECVECGGVSREDERRFRAFLTSDEDGPAEAVVFCPRCSAKEFEGRYAG